MGCGTGYASGIFARLGAHVVALDEDASLIAAAERALATAGVRGVKTFVGPLDAGAHPFSLRRDLYRGAYEREPESLVAQLGEGGRLIGVAGLGRAAQVMLQVKTGEVLTGRAVFDASAPLLGRFAKKPEFAF